MSCLSVCLVYLSMGMFDCLYLLLPLCMSCLSVRLSVRLWVFLSFSLHVLTICLSVWLTVCTYYCLSICLVLLSVFGSFFLSACLVLSLCFNAPRKGRSEILLSNRRTRSKFYHVVGEVQTVTVSGGTALK